MSARPSLLKRPVPLPWVVAACVGTAVLFGAISVVRFVRQEHAAARSVPPPLKVPLWVPAASVVQSGRFVFSFEPADAVSDLRASERLDQVVAGTTAAEEAARKLSRWVRDQWEPGRPDPYPPPDAEVILRDIRAGRTGGFCAQYCYVLVQAIASLGGRARFVTISEHEVVEVWLPVEKRWTMLDPHYQVQVLDPAGRSLSALEIHDAARTGAPVVLSSGNRLEEDAWTYVGRFRSFAVWLRNDLKSRPLNFQDLGRYRVWFPAAPDQPPGAPALATPYAVDLYPGAG